MPMIFTNRVYWPIHLFNSKVDVMPLTLDRPRYVKNLYVINILNNIFIRIMYSFDNK